MLLFTLPNLAVSCPIHSITLFYLARTSHRLTLCIFASWKDLKPELLQLTHLFSQGISKAPFQVHYYSGRSRHSTETVSEFLAEAPMYWNIFVKQPSFTRKRCCLHSALCRGHPNFYNCLKMHLVISVRYVLMRNAL